MRAMKKLSETQRVSEPGEEKAADGVMKRSLALTFGVGITIMGRLADT